MSQIPCSIPCHTEETIRSMRTIDPFVLAIIAHGRDAAKDGVAKVLSFASMLLEEYDAARSRASIALLRPLRIRTTRLPAAKNENMVAVLGTVRTVPRDMMVAARCLRL